MGRTDRDRVGADPHEAGMAEAHLPGKAHQQIQAHAGERKHEHQRGDAVVVGGRKHQRQRDDQDGHRQHDRQTMIEECTHAHTRSAVALPNSPRGIANRTSRMTKKATASLYCEER